MDIDKQLIRRRFARRFASYHERAVVQKEMARRLASMIRRRKTASSVCRGLEIGVGTGFLSARLLASYPDAAWYFNDLAPEAFGWVARYAGQKNAVFLAGDAESLVLPDNLDLLASASAIQWFEDIPAFFTKARAVLRPGGLLALGTFGPGNMCELNHVSGGGLGYPAPELLTQWLRHAGFCDRRIDAWEQNLVFPNASAVLRHIRETGVNAVSAPVWTPRRLRRLCDDYEHLFSHASGEGVTLTYRPLLLTAVRKS